MNWKFRDGTYDQYIVDQVYNKNCYGLPKDLSGKVIIDIGAHVGSFAIACLDRGAEFVFAYEADKDNYDLLMTHVSQHPRADRCFIDNKAVVGNSNNASHLFMAEGYHLYGSTLNTGGKNVFQESGLSVSTIKIPDILPTIIRKTIWLKLDCEGAEHEILDSDLPWRTIEKVIGEAHEFTGLDPIMGDRVCSGLTIAARLRSVGYKVGLKEGYPEGLYLFDAERLQVIESDLAGSSVGLNVLFVGDTPSVSTGFARCTRAICDELYLRGHKVNILGINEHGDPSTYHSPIYPCVQRLDGGHDIFGNGRLPRLIDRLRPDLVILLQDPWNIDDYFLAIDQYNKAHLDQGHDAIPVPPIMAWLAVDSRNQPSRHLNKLHHLVAWTEFAKEELKSGGYIGECDVVPCGVDNTLFRSLDREECRIKLNALNLFPDLLNGKYIVGVVGRNQSRKRIDLTIQYFAEWVHRYNISDAVLYLYVGPTGEAACNIGSLVRYYNLNGMVALVEPTIGVGNDDSIMPLIYNSFDCYVTTSQAEGWGLTTHEALACGVPCIIPNNNGLGSWVKDEVALKIPCTSTALTAPMNARPHTIGDIPDKTMFIQGMNDLYNNPKLRDQLGKLGSEFASILTWNASGKQFVDIVERIMGLSNA